MKPAARFRASQCCACLSVLTALLLSACTLASSSTAIVTSEPVHTPSDQNAVEMTVSPAPATGRTLEEAEEIIREHLWNQSPSFARDLPVPVRELPVPEISEQLPVQIFRVTDGLFAQETFLIEEETVVRLGSAEGGRGVTSLKVSDLDWDGTAEVLFAYSIGSPVYHSRIGMVAPAYDATRTYEAGTAYLGDVALVEDGLTHVMVKAVAADDETSTLRYRETLGLLVIDPGEDDAKLELHVAEGLPDDLRRNLTSVSALPELAPETAVSVILPISHTLLPEDPTAYQGDLDALAEDFETYFSDVEEQLGAQDASSFTPDLSLLDAMVQSLRVERPWMSDLPVPPGE
jgi:hypothetical protein